MITDDLERSFTVDFLLQPPQRFINSFAFFQSNLCQTRFTSSPATSGNSASNRRPTLFSQAEEGIFQPAFVNGQNGIEQSQKSKTGQNNISLVVFVTPVAPEICRSFSFGFRFAGFGLNLRRCKIREQGCRPIPGGGGLGVCCQEPFFSITALSAHVHGQF